MAQADRVHSTPPTNTSATIAPQSSRRGFLVQAAGVAVGGAAIGAGLPLPAPAAVTAQSSAAETDPIFAAIEAHRRAVAAFGEAVDIEAALEVGLPRDRRRSRINVWEETIVETDDPRWIASERAHRAASDAMDDLAIDLLNTEPTTEAGVDALLRYFADQDEGLFPDEVSNDDGSAEAFGAYLVRHAADALHRIALANCSMTMQVQS
jgi:hypothetical protein